MITSFEVGAVFRIVDDASPKLRALSEQLAKMDTLTLKIQGNMDRLGASFGPLGLETSRATDKMLAGLTDFNLGIDRSLAKVGELREAMKTLSVSSIGSPSIRHGSGLPGAGSAGGGGSSGFSGMHIPVPGGGRFHMGGSAALAGAGALGFGTLESAEIDSAINRMLMTGGVGNTGDLHSNKFYDPLRTAILDSYAMTGMPIKDIEEAIQTGTRGLAGVRFEDRLKIMPQLLRSASTEAYLKQGTSLKEGMEAFVGLGHMSGQYSPETLGKLSEHFAYLSTTTPSSVRELARASGYAIPMLRTADFDPGQLLLMLTSMERAGITNTKAGTWIGQLGMQSFPGTSLMSKQLFQKHEGALKQLGLIDENDKPTWFTNGKPDLVKMTGIAGEHLQAMDPANRLAIEKALWGQQGGRAAALFADPTTRGIMANVANEEKNFLGGEAQWKQIQSNDPMIQFRRAMAEFNSSLISLGSVALPVASMGVRGLADIFKSFNLIHPEGDHSFLGLGGAWGHVKDLGSNVNKYLGWLGGKADLPSNLGSPMSGGPAGGAGRFLVPGIGWTDGNGKPVDAIHDGVLAALNDWAGLGAGGSFGGRYGHGAGGRFGHNATGEHAIFSDWSKAGASPAEREAFIRKTASALGIDPGIAMRVARSEGFRTFTGDGGHSHGDFQLYDRGEGALFRAATGKDPANPANWMAADKWALSRASKNGWGAWHGARNTGIGDHQGIGQPIHIHIENTMDGHKVSKVVTHHQTRMAWAPRSAPFHSSYAYATSPDIGWETG